MNNKEADNVDTKVKKNFFTKAKDKAVKLMDQNDDGKFDMKDVSQVAGTVGNAVKKTASSVRQVVDTQTKKVAEKSLLPIFEQDLFDPNFSMTKLVRICEIDKKHAENIVCKGSIGYYTETRDMRAINIYRESMESFGITVYPNDLSEFYYVDPKDRDRYIALDEYFNYIKTCTVAELQKIAHDLGATYFKVTYKEKKICFSDKKIKGNLKNNKNAVSGELVYSAEDFLNVEIAAEMNFVGHKPVKPTLCWLEGDANIKNLIDMRMSNSIQHQKFQLKLINSSGIKENDAIKIDAVLKSLKCTGNMTVTAEAKNEARRYLEYEIFF